MPSQAELLIESAARLQSQGQYAEAAEKFQKALRVPSLTKTKRQEVERRLKECQQHSSVLKEG